MQVQVQVLVQVQIQMEVVVWDQEVREEVYVSSFY